MPDFNPASLSRIEAIEIALGIGWAKMRLAQNQQNNSPGLLANELNKLKVPKPTVIPSPNAQWSATDVKNFRAHWSEDPDCRDAMLIGLLQFGPLYAFYLLSLLDSASLLHAGFYQRTLYSGLNHFQVWRMSTQPLIQLASHGIEMALKGLRYSFDKQPVQETHSLVDLWKDLNKVSECDLQDAIQKKYEHFNHRVVGNRPAQDSSGMEVPVASLPDVLYAYEDASITSRYFMDAAIYLRLIKEENVPLMWLLSVFAATVAIVCRRVEEMEGKKVWVNASHDYGSTPPSPITVNGQVANSGWTGTLRFQWSKSDTLQYHYEEFISTSL